jgi:LmbE family N-acetylglucosaminyl deacetylase
MSELTGFEAFDDVRRLIVVAAHPDDLETMCGGVVALLAQRGVVVFSVNCTLGDIGTQDAAATRPALATTRLVEAEDAARLLGIEQVVSLGHHDGELVADLELRAQIARLYRSTQADTLFTFDPYWAGQIHPDHRAAGQAALDAYIPSKMPLYRPEQLHEHDIRPGCLSRVFLFAAAREPDIVVDVSPVYETKLAACLAHRSQFPKGMENLDWLQRIDEENGKAINAGRAEKLKRLTVW